MRKTLSPLLAWALVSTRLLAQPVITTQPANQIGILGSNVTFNVTVSGTGPFTYQWQLNGTNLPNNIITTVAGGGFSTVTNGGNAMNTFFFQPHGIAVDAADNLFILDYINGCVWKVDTNKIISTAASGLSHANGLAFDAAGNLFIADTGANRIRKVNTNGVMTTVAGTNTLGFSGDGGSATNARLNSPYDIGFDGIGNMYIADYSNHRIRKVDTNGIITTVAGNGGGSDFGDGLYATNGMVNISDPSSIAVAPDGSFAFNEDGFSKIRRVGTNGIINTFLNGTGGYSPCGLAFDSVGNLFIANTGINCIRLNGTNVIVGQNPFGGFSGDGGVATKAKLNLPNDVALDAAGNLFIADTFNNRIRMVSYAGNPTLTLNNFNTNSVGTYNVIIANYFGSVTSSIVNASLALPPITPTFTQTNNNVINFTWTAVAGLTYQMQYKTNLSQADWINLGSSITTTNNAASVLDSVGADPQRFYRVLLVQ